MSMPTEEKEKPARWFHTLPFAKYRDFSIFLLILAVAWRVATETVVVPQFSFEQLLNLIMAVFAIWLSIALYLRGGEVADRFYNNTYQFTKDISETLGRMDERYNEKMQGFQELMKQWPWPAPQKVIHLL